MKKFKVALSASGSDASMIKPWPISRQTSSVPHLESPCRLRSPALQVTRCSWPSCFACWSMIPRAGR